MNGPADDGRRLRVIVCGTTFGQFYIAALAALAGPFELAGLLARGSARSVDCARRAGVPLVTDPERLPDGIDIACVVVRSGAMGGRGSELAGSLLRRGINVLQEQPVHHDELATSLREAQRHGVTYRLGDLYVQLPVVRRFVAAARVLLARHPAVYVDAACSIQVAFPLFHILGDALGSVRPWRIAACPAGGDSPFTSLTGVIGGIPTTLRVQNQIDPNDPDNHLHLLHRVAIGTDAGTLTLTDTHGPVTWSPRLHIPEAVRNTFDFAAGSAAHLGEPSTTVLGPPAPPSYRRILTSLWPSAVGRDLLALRAAILAEGGPSTRPEQYHLALCQLWREATSQLGYPELLTPRAHRPLQTAELVAAVTAVDGEAGEMSTLPGPVVEASGMVATVTAAAEEQVRGLTAGEVGAFVERLDRAVLQSMLLSLQRQGVLRDPDRSQAAGQILAAARVAPQHHGLIGRWLDVLAGRGMIRHDGDRFRGVAPLDPVAARLAWEAVEEAGAGRLGCRDLVAYLRRNAERLPELMTGEERAVLLLFPQGRAETAGAIYRDPVTARYLNAAVATAVRRLAADTARGRALRVLEVGAGTGATTEAVLRELDATGPGAEVDYLFTDLSMFFLTTAKERLAGDPRIRFGLFDVDRDGRHQGFTAGTFDVVVAAGVLNNARDTDASVRRLVELLAASGWLLITEPTGEHCEILASQAFMMTPAEDARLRSRSTFLSRRQWLDVLDRAGAELVLDLPGESHVLAPLGQQFFAARIPTPASPREAVGGPMAC